MEYNKEISKYQIYINTWPSSAYTSGYGIIKKSMIGKLDEDERRERRIFGNEPKIEDLLSECPENSFYIDVFLEKSFDIYEYVDIQKDERIQKINRQEVNPFFINYGFFDTITKNHIITGEDLTFVAIDFIREVRPDKASLLDQEIRDWYTELGRFELPLNEGEPDEVTLEILDRVSLDISNIVSKANYFNIDINN